MDESLDTLGKRLKFARKKLRKMSQPALAKHLGVTQQAISDWEKGDTTDPRKLPDAAQFLGVSYEWLRNGTGPIEQMDDEFIYLMRSVDSPAVKKLLMEMVRTIQQPQSSHPGEPPEKQN